MRRCRRTGSRSVPAAAIAWHDHRMPPDAARHARRRRARRTGPDGDCGDDRQRQPVDVAVAVTWLPAPSRVPLAVGAAVGAGLVILALVTRHRLAWPLLAVAVAAAGIGWWQYSSLPSETGPLLVWWLLPAIATRRRWWSPWPSAGAWWPTPSSCSPRSSWACGWSCAATGVFRALIPTDAPVLARRGRDGGDRRGCRRGGDRARCSAMYRAPAELRQRTAAARPWPAGKTTACDGTPLCARRHAGRMRSAWE